MRQLRRAIVCVALVPAIAILVLAADANAQTAAKTARPRLEIGVTWTGGAALGSVSANLTAPDGSTVALFSTASEIGPAFGPDVRLSVPLKRSFQVEADGAWTRADLRTRISGDFEGAPGVTAAARISVFSIEGAGVWSWKRTARLEAFVRVGAGWMRELSADDVAGGDGRIASGGAGVKYWWREHDRGLLGRLGFRSEARLISRSGGLSLGTSRRVLTPGVTAGVMIGL